jgi:glycopeptide antibiotics resistance protein
VVEFIANIGMFVPLGLLLGLALPSRRGWVPFVAVPLGSVAIEITQYLFLPDRFGTPRDVLSNSIGAIIGGGIAVVVHRRLARRTRAD